MDNYLRYNFLGFCYSQDLLEQLQSEMYGFSGRPSRHGGRRGRGRGRGRGGRRDVPELGRLIGQRTAGDDYEVRFQFKRISCFNLEEITFLNF